MCTLERCFARMGWLVRVGCFEVGGDSHFAMRHLCTNPPRQLPAKNSANDFSLLPEILGELE